MKVETFKTITEAVNFVLDKNMYYILIPKFEEELMNNKAYWSITYGIKFVIDENHINN